MEVAQEQAVSLLKDLKFGSAEGWNAKKLATKLNKIDELADDETVLASGNKANQKLLGKLLKAVAKGEQITIAGEEQEEEAEEAQKPKKTATTKAKRAEGKAKAAVEEDEEEEEEGETVAQQQKRVKGAAKGGKKGGAKAEKAEKAPTTPGVRASRSRPYLAGIVVKKHAAAAGGLAKAGITQDMVDELNEAYGKPNPTESMFCLRNAWHAIRGYITKGNEGDLEGGDGEE